MTGSRIALVVLAAALPLSLSLPAVAQEEPEQVRVQHILIGFKKSVPGKKLDRGRKDAAALAQKLLERAQAEGADFDAMVKKHTNDSYPGTFVLINSDTAPVPRGAYRRSDMAYKFGDASFSIEVGEVTLVKHHAVGAPYGFHVIKRLE